MLKMSNPSKLGPGEANEGPPWIWPQILFQEWNLSDLGSPPFTPPPPRRAHTSIKEKTSEPWLHLGGQDSTSR